MLSCESLDALYLKDGSIIRGIIIEHNSEEIKIESGDNTWVIKREIIERIDAPNILISSNNILRARPTDNYNDDVEHVEHDEEDGR